MICPSCNATLPDGSAFCPKCGFKIADPAPIPAPGNTPAVNYGDSNVAPTHTGAANPIAPPSTDFHFNINECFEIVKPLKALWVTSKNSMINIIGIGVLAFMVLFSLIPTFSQTIVYWELEKRFSVAQLSFILMLLPVAAIVFYALKKDTLAYVFSAINAIVLLSTSISNAHFCKASVIFVLYWFFAILSVTLPLAWDSLSSNIKKN